MDSRPTVSGVLAILGAGGHGRVVADCAHAAGWFRVVFFDDAVPSGPVDSWPYGGTAADLIDAALDFDGVVVGIGRNAARLEWHSRLKARGAALTTVLHPRAWVSPGSTVSVGSVLCAGALVNTGATLGEAVIVNTGATIDHDCVIGDGVHLSPGANLAGGVRVGQGSWIGIGAAVREGIQIGAEATIGAGSVVVKAVGAGMTVVGNPATPLRKK